MSNKDSIDDQMRKLAKALLDKEITQEEFSKRSLELLQSKGKADINKYISLIELYIQKKISALEFSNKYYEMRQHENKFAGEEAARILITLFEYSEGYSPIWSKEDKNAVTDKILYEQAVIALMKLRDIDVNKS